MNWQELKENLLLGKRRALSRAITLIESTREEDQENALSLMESLPENSGSQSLRIAISGPPGVGKSTFLESFGLRLANQGHKVAVLAIDPSSAISGGSILGDKTRMQKLSLHENAFIRPSPSSGTLGGAAKRTLEAVRLCEAAGYDRVFVESVGVGQSETALSHMTDIFLLLALPNSGDELQGMKRGIMEVADLVFVSKSDLNREAALGTAQEIRSALHLFRPRHSFFTSWVGTGSSLNGEGQEELLQQLKKFETAARESGALDKNRREQLARWFETMVREEVLHRFLKSHQGSMDVLSRRLINRQVGLGQALKEIFRTPA